MCLQMINLTMYIKTMNSSSFNLFAEPRRCSLINSTCYQTKDRLQSCPFGEIPAMRMACLGSLHDRQRGAGKCGPAWSEVGDPCIVGPAACMSAVEPLYCQQAQLGNPNLSPGFNQNEMGAGYCMRTRQ